MKNKYQVVLLPTDSKSQILQHDDEGKSLTFFKIKQRVFPLHGMKPQHLYILSDDKIEEGDWCIQLGMNRVEQWSNNSELDIELRKKIIATTDRSLQEVSNEITDDDEAFELSMNPKIKPIPQSFVEEYCKNPVDEVFVEMELNAVDSKFNIHLQEHENISKLEPVLTDNNEIIISPVEEKMYTREELIQKINEYRIFSNQSDNSSESNLEYWIKENL